MSTATNCFRPQENELKIFKSRLEGWIKDTKNKEDKKLLQQALRSLEESGEAYFISLMSIAQSEYGVSENMHISSIYSTSKTDRNNMAKLRQQLPKIIKTHDKQVTEETKIENIKTLGQASIILYGKNKGKDLPTSKNAPREHQDTLYIFPENLQAFDGNKYDIEYEQVENPEINVKGTAAKLRTDSNGDRNPNVIGLVVKKDAQRTIGTKVEWVSKDKNIDDILKASFSLEERDKFGLLLNDFVERIKKSLGIEKEFDYAKNASNYYEVSTNATDDGNSDFSADKAKFNQSTTINGIDISNLTINEAFAKLIKKNKSKLNFNKLTEDSYWETYLLLYQEWAKQNSKKIEQLRKDAKGKVITSNINIYEARALSDILNGSVYRTVWIPETFAMENAGLPMQLAEDLQHALESLGIISSIQESALTKGKNVEESQRLYGVVLDNIAKPTKTTTTRSSVNKTKIEEASQSAQAIRPDEVTIHLKNINIMTKIYPDISERKSRINTLAELLLYFLDDELVQLQQILNSIPDNELKESYGQEFVEIKHKINDTTSKHNRLKALLQYSTTNPSDRPLQKAVNNLNSLIAACSCNDLENIPTELIDKIYNTFYGEFARQGFLISDEYVTELNEGHEPSVKELKQRAKNFIVFFSQLNRGDGLKEAMLNEATSIINEKTGIQISFKDGGMVNNDKDVITEQEEQEGSANVKSEVALVQWKIKNPLDTVTARIKDLLRNAYQVYSYEDVNGKKVPHYKRNSLGLRIPIKTEVTFYYLIEAYSEMTSSDDFDRVTEEVLNKYPWFFEIYNKLQEDNDLRNEFYRCMRNVLTTYATITKNGRLKILNNGYTVSIFLDNIQKNYNGGITFTSTSLYDEEGKPNQDNLTKFRESFVNNDKLKQANKKVSSKQERIANTYKYAPLNRIQSVLHNNNSDVAELLEVLKFLSQDKTFGLNNILRSLGIDTEDFDLTAILPNLTDEQIESINNYDTLNTIWSKQNRERVRLILDNFHTIVAGYGTTASSNMLEDYKTATSMIGRQLVSTAQTVTALQFWDGEHNRNSYTKPDFVSTLFNVIGHRADDTAAQERATLYLKKQYDYDFFEDMPLIQEIINDDGTLREKLKKISLLKSQLNVSGRSDIGSMDRFDYLKAGIALFDLSVKQNNDLAYYLNPLYSDAEAMDVFVLPRERGNNYKEVIADKLTQVALAEWKRIWAHHIDKSGVKVDNFNTGKKRAERFCIIEGLNAKRKYWLEEMDKRKRSEDAANTTYQEDEQWIRDQIRNELLTPSGNGILAKLFNQLKDSITEEQRANLIQQYKNSSQYGGIVENDTDEDDDTEATEAKRLAEEEEQDKQQQSEEETAAEIAEFNDRLERFFYNDFYTQSQLIAMLVGDPAYFKDYRDMVKRSKQQIYSCGEKLYAKNEDGTPLQRRVVYIEDSEVMSSTFPSIKSLLEGQVEKGLQSQIESFFDAYINIKETDGQSLVTPKAMEQLYKAMGGRWSTEVADAFNALYQGKLNLAAWNTIANAVKPLMITYETKIIAGRKEKVAVQHKDSEYMLTALYGLFNSAYNKSPEYRALQRFMELHNIQSAKFKSCVKVGHHSPLNLNYSIKAWELYKKQAIENSKTALNLTDEQAESIKTYKDLNNLYKQAVKDGKISYKDYKELFLDVFKYDSTVSEEEKLSNRLLEMSDDELDNYLKEHPNSALASLEKQYRTYGEENAVKTVDMEDIMILQPDADHLTDSEALDGSQKRNIMPADLEDYGDGPEGRKYAIEVGNETYLYTRKELVDYYDRIIELSVIDAYEALLDKFKDAKTLKNYLLEEAKKNPKYGKDVVAALSLETDENIFEAPFNSPTLNNKMADLLLSMAKNHIQRQKIKGGNAVLNTAYSTDLHIEYNEDSSVKCIQCYLPAFSRDFVEDYLVEQEDGSWTLDFEAIKKASDEDLLKIIGYRIPTEQKYSCFPLKIVGFNPITAGAEITLPADAVAMSGFDFDIDKLFLMIKEYQRSNKSPKLGVDFINWALKNKKELRNDTVQQVIKEIVDGKPIAREQSFSADEINELYDRDSVFAEYYDSKDIDVKYKTLKPKLYKDADGRVDLLKTVSLEDVKDGERRRKIRNNMYIDLTYSILTSKEGSRLMMQPANYDDVKLASAIGDVQNAPEVIEKLFIDYGSQIQEIGMYTFLTHFGMYTRGTQDNPLANSEALEEYYEDNKIPDEPCSFYTRAKVMEDLMAGRNLIGITAVNSSRHYKFQFAEFTKEVNGKQVKYSGVPMSKSASFTLIIGGKEIVFDRANPIKDPVTGVLLSYYLSQYQAAAPDNGKDPRLGKMGFTPKTAETTCYQAAIGIPIELVSVLNNAASVFKQPLPSLPNNAEIKTDVMDVDLAVTALFKFKAGIELSDDELLALHSMKAFWNKKIEKPAEDYQVSSAFVRADSPNGALAVTPVEVVMNIIKRLEALAKMREPDFSFPTMSNLVDMELDTSSAIKNGKIDKEAMVELFNTVVLPRLQAFYSCGINDYSQLVESYLPCLSSYFINTLLLVKNNSTYSFNSKTQLTRFINEFVTFALTQCPMFKGNNPQDSIDKRNYYIHDFPMKFKLFLEAKNDDGEYIHKEVRDLTFIKNLRNDEYGIKFPNIGGKMTSETRDYYTEAITRMFASEDAEVRAIATDLLRYSFYENGIIYGHSNFGTLFPTEVLQEIEGFFDSIRQANELLLSGDYDYLKNYAGQFLLNHSELIQYVNLDKNHKGFKFDGKKLIIPRTDSEIDLVLLDTTAKSETYKFLIRTAFHYGNEKGKRRRIFKYIGDNYSGDHEYELVEFNTTDMVYYDADSFYAELNMNSLKKKGVVVNPKFLKATKPATIEESVTEPELSHDDGRVTEGKITSEVPTSGTIIYNNGTLIMNGNSQTIVKQMEPVTDNINEVSDYNEPSSEPTEISDEQIQEVQEFVDKHQKVLDFIENEYDEAWTPIEDDFETIEPVEDPNERVCEPGE